jgi:hypothetical protein
LAISLEKGILISDLDRVSNWRISVMFIKERRHWMIGLEVFYDMIDIGDLGVLLKVGLYGLEIYSFEISS